MNAWGEHANVLFSETKGVGKVRIARLDAPDEVSGYWSYLGTEILEAPEDEPTLNLDSFTMRTSEAEFRRVVRHEAGHTLGFDHEHMRGEIVKRIDRAKAYAFYDKDQGWTRKEVDEQVLTPLAKKSIMGTTEADPLSIMCYQLPGKIMKDGKPVKGGADINANDFEFAKKLYPKKKRSDVAAPEPLDRSMPSVSRTVGLVTDSVEADERFELVVMDEFRPDLSTDGKSMPKFAQVFASYCGARVTSVMKLRAEEGEEKTRLRADHQHTRTDKSLHESPERDTPRRPRDGRLRTEAIRHAVPGRRASALRRGPYAPASPSRYRADIDDPVDRRKAVGVCV